ncbi:hypothetical protein PDESU_05100 [Pontiella desulfatans]|uniref:Uncharacterized protein n=1 Tax=Pontiella desulfatans TaxID=2750659 RepID=A0A6C2U9E4_PONDE|nr:hypothetical protein [Pontiella desulfatans]VGO16509.1 hypothetical protein PDESU_05100 [Pontiella desulfatans]
MAKMQKVFGLGIVALCSASVAMAALPSAKLVDSETGASSEVTVLTNGASFKMGEKTYRLELDQSADDKFIESLSQERAPLRIHDLPAYEAFNMLTLLSDAAIVCSRSVEKDLKISINTQHDSIISIIDQICFQIDAEATVRNKTFWITAKKQ